MSITVSAKVDGIVVEKAKKIRDKHKRSDEEGPKKRSREERGKSSLRSLEEQERS